MVVHTDLKLMPLMNIIIALIPMLLLSAVFIEVKVIETSLPRDADASAAGAQAPAEPPLDLAVHVRGNAYIVEGHGIEPQVLARRSGAASPDSLTALQLTRVLQAIVAIPTLVTQGFLVGLVEGIAEQVEESGIRAMRAMIGSPAARGGQVVAMPARAAAPGTQPARPTFGPQGGTH